jgi:hypothetical protein
MLLSLRQWNHCSPCSLATLLSYNGSLPTGTTRHRSAVCDFAATSRLSTSFLCTELRTLLSIPDPGIQLRTHRKQNGAQVSMHRHKKT